MSDSQDAPARAGQPDSITDRIEIAPGVKMPRLGLGTWRAHGDTLVEVLLEAFRLGYRLIDTSANYYNEEEVGEAISLSGIARDEIFVTTKLEAVDQGYDTTPPALHSSLRRLGLDYVDLYLIHWPQASKTESTWRAMQELQQTGLARSIGVSNFSPRDLEQVLSMASIPPAVNQVELNPLKQRPGLREYCQARGIIVEAWAPVIEGAAERVPVLVEVGRRDGKTAAQVSLRWLIQHGAVAIPKTVHESRLRENADIFDFELTGHDMQTIDQLESGRRLRV